MTQKIIRLCLLILSFTLISSKSAEDFVSCVYAQLGKSYRSGGKGPNYFDCSGLVYYCFDGQVPGTSSEQYANGRNGDGSRGDLIFFDTEGKGKVTHVGVCIGDGKMIHAPKPGEVVKLVVYKGNNYWQKAFIGYKRYWN